MREDVAYGDSVKSEVSPYNQVGDIQIQVERLAGTIERLDVYAAKLEQRLEMVLRPTEPSVDAETSYPQDVPMMVPLAQRLDNLNDRLFQIWSHLEFTQERISI